MLCTGMARWKGGRAVGRAAGADCMARRAPGWSTRAASASTDSSRSLIAEYKWTRPHKREIEPPAAPCWRPPKLDCCRLCCFWCIFSCPQPTQQHTCPGQGAPLALRSCVWLFAGGWSGRRSQVSSKQLRACAAHPRSAEPRSSLAPRQPPALQRRAPAATRSVLRPTRLIMVL